MSDLLLAQGVTMMSLLSAMLSGLLIGLVFFYVLWLTTQQGLLSARPLLWFLGGFIVRLTLAGCGFYLVGQQHWPLWLACLVGFLVGRTLCYRWRVKSRLPATISKTGDEGCN